MYPEILQKLIDELSGLPGIGRRSAERIALYLLDGAADKTGRLGDLILQIQDQIKPCNICNNFSTDENCSVCTDLSRDSSLVCIVEYPKDVIALEKTGVYRGIYYVLLGSIAPLEGKGPDSLNLSKLIKRIKEGKVKEVIIATDSDSEGQATAMFLKKALSGYNIKISRIGIGIPLGAQIEFADVATLGKAMQERRDI